ncbi:hypothetical protein TNCV_3522141 [Trichonephila clavipes]|uniref:Uncharacterized protein n=1 Tax=Trichonephila clavipes TaxID=2585209 RepID=A0A8X7BG65_TRICX|nr:hypothetical protein TNCV_3522141 [Trichonephila clavipes]
MQLPLGTISPVDQVRTGASPDCRGHLGGSIWDTPVSKRFFIHQYIVTKRLKTLGRAYFYMGPRASKHQDFCGLRTSKSYDVPASQSHLTNHFVHNVVSLFAKCIEGNGIATLTIKVSFDQQLASPKHPTHFQWGLDLENALAIRDVEYPRWLYDPEQRVFDDMLRCRP